MDKKSRAPHTFAGISATRLSQGDPLGFPSHSREWFSIIVYRLLFSMFTLIAGNRILLCDDRHKYCQCKYLANFSLTIIYSSLLLSPIFIISAQKRSRNVVLTSRLLLMSCKYAFMTISNDSTVAWKHHIQPGSAHKVIFPDATARIVITSCMLIMLSIEPTGATFP